MDYSDLTIDTGALDSIVGRMLGDAPTFFKEHWRKRPLYTPGAGADCAGVYGVEQFLTDIVETQPIPYLSVSTRNGKRFFTKHTTAEDLQSAVLAGGVSAIKASKLWHGPVPKSWTWMRALFGSLCRTVVMTYMTPARSEDVDIFLAGPQSQLGTHFDTTDVFTLQVYGERKWTMDEEVHLDSVLEFARDRNWYPAKEIDFQGSTREITLRPGDTLYVPAYGVHHVTGVSWSVSLSLGLRAFNEIDFVEYLLEAIRLSGYMSYPPVASVAESAGECHAEAKLELMQRIRSLLGQVEGLALATLLAPLKLPTVFDTPTSALTPPGTARQVLGMFVSGFTLEEETNS
jgi:ribosomal protein L16 Arg81 hydroxylase